MADTKISALPASTVPLAGTEVLPIVQSSTTKQVSVANLTAGRAISATQLTLTTGNLIVANGQGIDFSATPGTGTSELLADYEEGTWTPVDGSGAGLTYSSATGYYTKIGRTVTVVFNVTYPATASASAARIGGLPFTAANTGSGLSNGCFNINNSGQAIQPSIVINDTNFAALIVAAGISATNAQLTGATLRGGLTYFV
jgi:hypothetical protein